jgi:protein-S-isoprenylcysteine O-methyltransferase Ste14
MAVSEASARTRVRNYSDGSEKLVNVRNDTHKENNDSTSGCHPVFINSFTYVGTLVLFIICLEILSLPTLPFPLNKSMLVSNDEDFAKNKHMKYLFIALWSLHFMRRTLEVLFVHEYKRRMPVIESVGAPVYYWFFAVWNSWSLRPQCDYEQSFLALVILGSTIFFLGETGNCICHIQLRNLRNETRSNSISSSASRHVIPYGFLFNYVSCPHYFFEILTWTGFFLATWTLAAVLFLVATIVTLVVYAGKKHKAYLQEFDGKGGTEIYPANRKALIPFIY